jgi:hypothetical protein
MYDPGMGLDCPYVAYWGGMRGGCMSWILCLMFAVIMAKLDSIEDKK